MRTETECPPVANQPEYRVRALEMPPGWGWPTRKRLEAMYQACLAEAGYPVDGMRLENGLLWHPRNPPVEVIDRARRLVFDAVGVRYEVVGQGGTDDK